jgi:NTE family protein
MTIETITNLGFQGGSVKGAGYIGGVQSLEENIDMTKVKRVSGTSAGALTACLLALGCDSKRADDLLPTFVFKDVLDDVEGGVNTRDNVLKGISKHEEQGKPVVVSKVPVKTVKKPIIKRELEQYGIYEGKYIREWFNDFIETQVSTLTNGKYSGENLTFSELHELT